MYPSRYKEVQYVLLELRIALVTMAQGSMFTLGVLNDSFNEQSKQLLNIT